MTFKQLKYFLAVVDIGTFLGASEHVCVSQPTLSAGINKLEELLGVKLFYRGSRHATLTPDGESLLIPARKAYKQLDLIKYKFKNEKSIITIGVINTIPISFIEEIISLHKQLFPLVLYEIEVGNLKFLQDLFVQKKLNFLFTTELNIDMEFYPLFNEELNLVVSNKSSLSKCDVISVAQINNHAFIERSNCESWCEVSEMFESNKINLHTVCRAESDETILSLVASNLGISIMPYRRSPYEVKFIRIKELSVERTLGMYYESSNLTESFSDTAQRVYSKTI